LFLCELLIGAVADQTVADHRGQVNSTASENESDWALRPGTSALEAAVVLSVQLVAGIKVDIGPTVVL
jgi:hypothetical protein